MSEPPDLVKSPPAVPAPSSEEAMLLAYLAAHDAACPACKYNLRQITRPVCPECGRSVRLTIGTIEPVWRWWAYTAIATAIGAGPGILMWVAIFKNQHGRMFDSWDNIEGRVANILLFFCVVCTPQLLLLLALRRWFTRWPLKAQKRIAIAVVNVAVLAVVALLWLMTR